MPQLFTNNANSVLAAAIDSTATTVTVAQGDGDKFPNPQGVDDFLVTVFQRVGTTEQNWEIMRCTSRVSDVLTVVRAQEGTTARGYMAGDFVEARLTAGAVLPVRAGALTGALNEAPPVSMVCAAGMAIGAAASNTVNVTGAGTIKSFDAAPAGVTRRLVFAAAVGITYSAASMILPGATSLQLAPGDVTEWVSLGGGNWRMTALTRASGDVAGVVSIAHGGTGATTAAAARTALGLAAVASSGAKADVGLGSVDNTSDADKPISTAVQAALDAKASASAAMQLAQVYAAILSF